MEKRWKRTGCLLAALSFAAGLLVWDAETARPGLAKVQGETQEEAAPKEDSCGKARGYFYEKKGNKVIVHTPKGVRRYKCYAQVDYGYEAQGCVVTALATAASGFGKQYSPKKIQDGGKTKKYSARYAIKKMGGSALLHGKATISVATATQILKDIGIRAKAVYRFTKKSAIRQITAHVKAGKPVLIKANARKYKGVQIANAHHALLLVGLDEDGYGVFIDPMKGKVNYAHGSGNFFRMKISTMVNYHMTQASGNYRAPYVTSLKTAGGYILIG